MGLAIRIETTEGYGPYYYTDPGQWPHKGASMVRHPTPYYDFGPDSDYELGIFGFPNFRAMSRWFHHVERLRLKRVCPEVTWQVAFYKTETVFAQSQKQMSFYGQRIDALPIEASGLSIARKWKELCRNVS